LRPRATIDSIAYVSIAEGSSENTFKSDLESCNGELPGEHKGCGDLSSNLFAEVGGYSAQDYQTWLRLYENKPLFNFLLKILHRDLHISAFLSLRAVSAVSFLGLSIVIWFWLREYLSLVASSLMASFVMCLKLTLEMGQNLLPDGLSTALLLLAAYLLLYRKNKWLGAIALVLLPLVRPDNIIFVFFFAGALILRRALPAKIRASLVVLLGLGCVLFNFVLQKAVHALPWPVLYQQSFGPRTTPSEFAGYHLLLSQYVHGLVAYGSLSLLVNFPPILFFAVLALAEKNFWQPLRDLVWASLAAIAVRLLLFPGMDERYYAWLFLICVIGATAAFGQFAQSKHSWFGQSEACLP